MKLQHFPAIVADIFEWSCRQDIDPIHSIFRWLHVFDYVKNIRKFHYTKYIKMCKQESLTIGHNILEFFCVPLHTNW